MTARPAGRDDSGVTLIEMMVSMGLMGVFMAIFTTGMIGMFTSANKNESINDAQAQLNIAFLNLDREVRYASTISTPGQVAGAWYVELLITNSGTARCTEIRLDPATAKLERRSWVQGSPASSGDAWRPLASRVTSTAPFTLIPADPEVNFQRLRLRLLSTAGGANSGTTTETDVTFTALNTSLKNPEDELADQTVCTEGRTQP
jgi:prepilin-type N-terminal cleavage/methylation domain-containing protein